jgi:hypothetical protein
MISAPDPPTAATSKAPSKSAYIAGPVYDWVFFLLPPLMGLVLGMVISGTDFSERKFWLASQRVTGAGLMIGILIHAHLVAVFFRSHNNPDIFKLHPIRFILAPLLLYAAMMWSEWVLVPVTVLVVFWDVYHSALQTFGFARIYDRNRGNDPALGRRLDFVLNHLLYAGPIVAGAAMLAHFRKLELFEEVGATFFGSIPVFMTTHQRYFTWAVLGAGTLFLIYYVLAHVRLHRQGYRISFEKVFLLVTTGFCSIYSWGFNAWGEAFFIMNFFHAVQYLGLVWWSENGHIRRRLRLEHRRAGKPVAACVFIGLLLAYGYWAELQRDDVLGLWCIIQVVSIMHFWYDGFIWSVRRKQV